MNFSEEFSNAIAYLHAQMHLGLTTNVSPDTAKDDRITALEQEVMILNKQLEVLKEVMVKSSK